MATYYYFRRKIKKIPFDKKKMTRVERADDFDEHATSKRPLARGIRANDAGLRAMRSVPSSSRRRATTTNRRLLNAARTAITHVGKR